MDSSRNGRLAHEDDPLSSKLALHAAAARAAASAANWLLNEQQPDGHWVGELEGDTILESEYVLLFAWLGEARKPTAVKAAEYIRRQQLPEGGWSIYPGGKVEISTSVKAYFALKLTGHHPSAEYMQRARRAILLHGGADAVNSFTRFYLALLGQISYDQCPAVPPEAVLLPRWFPINMYSISAWSRTIVVPLSIMSACRPVARISAAEGIRELFLRDPRDWPPLRCPGLKGGTGFFSWDNFFRRIDGAWKAMQRWRLLPLRRWALVAAKRWMLERFSGSEGLGAIFPPMIWSVVALKCLGCKDDSPELRYCHEQLAGLIIEDEDAVRLQPCKSPVWDTAISLRALVDAGLPLDDPRLEHGVAWLLARQIERPGDWRQTVDVPGGGWCFEYANDYYPDLDDTAMVVMALAEQFAAPPTDGGQAAHAEGLELCQRREVDASENEPGSPPNLLAATTRAIDRAERWMLAMQNRDGGWGAFDRDNDRAFLCHVPFADHNAMIDPSTPDLAARVLEALGMLGRRLGDRAVDRAVAYLRATQEADGSWFGRWGVNYIYGAWQALTGLSAAGVPTDDPAIVAGAHWLLAYQQPCGGWGESPDSYADPRLKGQGRPTASQTAWAVLGLIAAGLRDHPATLRGIRYLAETQTPAGDWHESEFTGTGFPRVFYLRYHLYRQYFPLMALARWAGCRQACDLAAAVDRAAMGAAGAR